MAGCLCWVDNVVTGAEARARLGPGLGLVCFQGRILGPLLGWGWGCHWDLGLGSSLGLGLGLDWGPVRIEAGLGLELGIRLDWAKVKNWGQRRKQRLVLGPAASAKTPTAGAGAWVRSWIWDWACLGSHPTVGDAFFGSNVSFG